MNTPRWFAGVACLWNEPNSRGECFTPQTFARSIHCHNIGSISIPIFVEHTLLAEWPDPVGRLLCMDASDRGLEVMFTIDPMSQERFHEFCELFRHTGSMYLSVGIAFHAWCYKPVPGREGRSPRFNVTDGLMVELSLSRQPAAGLAAQAHELDRLALGFGQHMHFLSS